MIKVGLSARFMSRSPQECGVGGKAIQYLEQNMANALARAGALVFLIPSIGTTTELCADFFRPGAYAHELDALVLQGGVDICPEIYGETPISSEIQGDRLRDSYELALIQAFVALKRPVLGICRGMQLINVARGGTLVQDIPSVLGSPTTHFCPSHREQIAHPVQVIADSYLSRLYGPTAQNVNSIHHQCVKKLGRDLVVEAICPTDGVIEAIRSTGESYLVGVQWHPEFHSQSLTTHLDSDLLFRDFLRAAHLRKAEMEAERATAAGPSSRAG